MLLISPSAETGGILFGITLLLCALSVLAVRAIDIKTRARIKPPMSTPKAKEYTEEKKESDKTYYIVKKKKTSGKTEKQAA